MFLLIISYRENFRWIILYMTSFKIKFNFQEINHISLVFKKSKFMININLSRLLFIYYVFEIL